MGLIGKIVGSDKAIKVVDNVVGIADKLIVDKDQKANIAKNIISDEMASGSSFIRSARPMIIYTGLVLVVLEFFGIRLLSLKLMEADKLMIESSTSIFNFYLMTWSGVVSIYIGGRSYEKVKSKFLKR
tara:strand:- start:540 stop:923 length:384 start_codon:yes stop_codon:yes gene_type:complete